MTPDLKNQIRAYYEATTVPIDIDAIAVDADTVRVGPVLDAVQRRSAMKTMTLEDEQRSLWWKGPRLAIGVVAATALVIVAAFAIVSLADSDDLDTAGALAAAEAYFEDFNAGDVDAILTSFTADVEISDSFVGQWTEAEFEMLLVWNTAQGATLSSPDCTVTEEVPGDSITVSCASQTNNAQVLAVGATPVPTIVTLVVAPGGISSLGFGYGSRPGFEDSTNPFEFWMEDHYPVEAEAVGFGNWTSVEEAERNGLLTAQYSSEWATYLEENNCTYRDFC